MSVASFLRTGALSLLATSVLLLAGCGSGNKEKASGTENAPARIVPVQAVPAATTDLAVTKNYSGSLEGEEQANIVARTSERITAVHVRVGQHVESGAVIISLDKSGATSQFFQAEANYKNSEKNLQRMKSLFSEGAVSQQTLDGAQTGFDVAKANFDAARSTVELVTPVAGEVTAVNANIGDLTLPGAVLATVARIGRMKVVFNINETDVTSLAIGQKVSVYSEAKPDTKVEGRIIQLSKSADVGSRSFEVKALFTNTKDSWFKPGMFCRVVVPLASRPNTLVVPMAAVQSDGTTSRVYVVRNGRSMERVVRTGISDGQQVEILDGVQRGDTVATVGVNNLKDGAYVTVVSM